jgi:hypothetical protein
MKNKLMLIAILFCLGLQTRVAFSNQEPSPFFFKTDSLPEIKKLNLNAVVLRDFTKDHLMQSSANAESILLRTCSGVDVPVLFFNRNSSTVLLVGQALPANKETMAIYAKLFSDYDVILFDYRWHKNYGSFLLKSLALCSPVQRILFDEEEEVRTVVDFLRRYKNYEKIIGLGECYSAFLFAKVQADDVRKFGYGPFTHLIFDSCWHSLKSFAESICDDPYLPLFPQEGGAPSILKAITRSFIVKELLLKVIFTFMHNVSIEEHLLHLNVPVLFIHGLKDLFVPQHQFEALWKVSCIDNRVALLTPYQHANNLQDKFLYRFICEKFISAFSIKEFIIMCDDLINMDSVASQ